MIAVADRSEYHRNYVRPDPAAQRRQKRAWSRALTELRRHHIVEFERYYRAQLDKEHRLEQLNEEDA